ncbi:MAG TPA: hypothetical protein PKD16_19115 [Saprospiraceae bacterium]|jgi:leucyl-tRNA synthetase|nr:hypothetical protein [Saprospiraceae bacterium]
MKLSSNNFYSLINNNVKKYVDGKDLQRVLVVPGKMINLVVKE